MSNSTTPAEPRCRLCGEIIRHPSGKIIGGGATTCIACAVALSAKQIEPGARRNPTDATQKPRRLTIREKLLALTIREKPRRLTIREKLLALMRGGRRGTVPELASEVGASVDRVRENLVGLEGAGLARRHGHPPYTWIAIGAKQ